MLFEGRTVEITSKKQAVKFRSVVIAPGSDRLAPLAKLIGEVRVQTDPHESRGWLHILHATIPMVPSSAFTRLLLCHPRDFETTASNRESTTAPSAPIARRLTSPYWDMPRSPHFIFPPYRRLYLARVHFTSLGDISRFLSHFPLVEDLYFLDVTWHDEALQLAPPQFLPSVRQEQSRLAEIVIDRCQVNARLFLQVLNLYRVPMLWALRHVDREAAVSVIETVFTAHNGSPSESGEPTIQLIRCSFAGKQTDIHWSGYPNIVCTGTDHHPCISVASEGYDGLKTVAQFICRYLPNTTGGTLRVAGLAIFCHRGSRESIQGLEAMNSLLESCALDKVVPSIPHFRALQGLVVGVDADPNDEACIATLTKTYEELLQSLSPEQPKYHWLCMRPPNRSTYVTVDLSSHKPTGANILLRLLDASVPRS